MNSPNSLDTFAPQPDDDDAIWDCQDKTGWRHYSRTYRDKNGRPDGGCRWSAPPPVPMGEDDVADPDILIQDERTMKFHPIPPGFIAPPDPSSAPDWLAELERGEY